MEYTFTKGTRYCAKIQLGLFEQFVSNEYLRDQLAASGKLSGISVEGKGRNRRVYGTANETVKMLLPSQVKSVDPV